MSYRLTHNNTVVMYKETIGEVNDYIHDILEQNKGLNPIQIVNVVMDNGVRQLIVYRYYTYYCEFFLVEKEF